MTKKELATTADAETLAALRESFPMETGFQRIKLPRIGLVSQDKTEGKGKQMKVTAEAGTFYIEKETDEINAETGRKVWSHDEIGTEFEGIILYQRKQLRFFDENTEMYTSSPVYDNYDEIIPLFSNKSEIARGTPAELKAGYKFINKEGKERSKLEDNRILYVLYEDDLYQLNLRGSSMYAFMTYSRTVLPNSVLTHFSSEAKEKGSIEWNQMTFKAKRSLDATEATSVLNRAKEILLAIKLEKGQYVDANKAKADKQFDALTDGK